MTHQTRAEQYVREKLPELMELSAGCEIEWEKQRTRLTGETFGSDGIFYCIAPSIKGVDSFAKSDSFWKILGHPIQLQHWLRVISDALFLSPKYMHGNGDSLLVGDSETPLKDFICFDLTTGQPATEADYQAFNEIVGV